MEKSLKLYTYITNEEGIVEAVPFPNKVNPVVLSSFQYDAKRMGGAPVITAKFKHQKCLDETWTGAEFVVFNGNRYLIKQTPTSSYSNTEALYVHECEFVSERIALDNVYFFDAVSLDTANDRIATNNSKVVFFGDIHEFASRLNYSLEFSGLSAYSVVVDEGVTSEAKLVTIENQFISTAIQEAYNTFNVPYYFVGKTIHFGEYSNIVSNILKYGIDNSLLSITKTNANAKVITKITGRGSSENIPWYYPDKTSKGSVGITGDSSNSYVIENMNRFVSRVAVDGTTVVKSGKVSFDLGDLVTEEYNYISAINTEEEVKVSHGASGSPASVVTAKPTTKNKKYFGYLDTDVNLDGKNVAVVIYSIGFRVIETGKVVIRVPYQYEKLPATTDVTGIMNFTYFRDVTCECARVQLSQTYLDTETKTIKLLDIQREYDYVESAEHKGYVEFDLGLLMEDQDYPYVIQITYLLNSGLYPYTFKIWHNTQLYAPLFWWYEQGKMVVEDLSTLGVSHVDPKDSTMWFKQTATGLSSLTQDALMPYVYRETTGAERFYYAKDGVYKKPNSSEYYTFDNDYNEDKPSEYIKDFDDIKPTIVNMTYGGRRIDLIAGIEADRDDNDAIDDDGNYYHPYFFIKLPPLGFNIFDCAIDDGEIAISATSGTCGACEWTIMVDENTKKNLVQVELDDNGEPKLDESGEYKLRRDGSGDIVCGRKKETLSPFAPFTDTTNNSVWVAVRKDKDTFGVVIPNVGRGYYPSVGDSYVFLNCYLPEAYIIAAEKRLEEELIKYMYENNVEKFNFSIKFSRIFLAENEDFLNKLNENVRLKLEYNNKGYELFVSSYSYKINEGEVLPEITVELTDTVSIQQNAIQEAISSATSGMTTGGSSDFLNVGLSYFVRKDVDDVVRGNIQFNKNITVKNQIKANYAALGGAYVDDKVVSERVHVKSQFVLGQYAQGSSGAALLIEEGGASYLEIDKLKVRMKAYFEELIIQKTETVAGKMIISPAGSLHCTAVMTSAELANTYGIEVDTTSGSFYRCFFKNEQNGVKLDNLWKIGDQGFCQSFGVSESSITESGNRYYWRLVVGVGENYIDLSEADCDSGSDVPRAGDIICHLGSRTEDERRNALIFSAVDTFSPSISLYHGIGEIVEKKDEDGNNVYDEEGDIVYERTAYSLNNADMVSFGVNQETNQAFFNVYGNAHIGTRLTGDVEKDASATYMSFTEGEGLKIKGQLHVSSTISSGGTLGEALDKASKGYEEDFTTLKNFVESELENIQTQVDGGIDTWFYEGVPTLENVPASDWTTDELKNQHLGDLYYDSKTGNAYRFQLNTSVEPNVYEWRHIEDTDIQAALGQASEAYDLADSKRRIFGRQPTNDDVYDIGDLWVNATYTDENGEIVYSNDILRCTTSKTKGEAFDINDWQLASGYTDDTYALAVHQEAIEAQEKAEKAAQDAADAANAATEASNKANQAQADANTANALLQEWSADGVISPLEKQSLLDEKARISADKNDISTECARYNLQSDSTYTAYQTAYNEYNTILSTLTETEGVVNIPADFEAKQTAYYQARTNVYAKISEAAKTVADNAQTSADEAQKAADAAAAKADELAVSVKAAQDAADAANAKAEEAQTAANNAQSAADSAAEKANEAKDVAYEANTRIEGWIADGVISPLEKQAMKDELASVKSEYSEIKADYLKYSVGDEEAFNGSTYVNDYNAYVAAMEQILAQTDENVNIGSEGLNIDLDALQEAYYNSRVVILGNISEAAKEKAEAAQAAADAAKDEAEKANQAVDEVKKNVEVALSKVNELDKELEELNTAVTEFEEDVRGAFRDGIITEAEAISIQKHITNIEAEYEGVRGTYKTLMGFIEVEPTEDPDRHTAELESWIEGNVDNDYLELNDAGLIAELIVDYNNLYDSKEALIDGINDIIKDSAATKEEIAKTDTLFDTFNKAYALFNEDIERANKKVQNYLKDYTDTQVAEVKKEISELGDALTEQNNSITELNSTLQDFMSDGVISASERVTIYNELKALETQYEAVKKEYEDVINQDILQKTTELSTLKDVWGIDDSGDITAGTYNAAYNRLIKAIITLADDKDDEGKDISAVTPDERAEYNNAYDDYKGKYADLVSALHKCNIAITTLNIDALTKAISNDYGFLLEALSGETITNGGLILTTAIALGQFTKDEAGDVTSFTPWSGISGVYDSSSNGNGIAFWAGGQAIDLFSYEKDADGDWIIPEGENPADFLVRMDGTGYAAGGNFWWESDGRLHADPLSFFVGEDQVGYLLSAFQVVTEGEGDAEKISYLKPQYDFDHLSIVSSGYIKIGSGYLRYDEEKNAFYVEKESGVAANFYATGSVSALGIGSNETGGTGGLITSVYDSTYLGKTFDSANYTDTFNADAINSIYLTTQSNSDEIADLKEEIESISTDISNQSSDKNYYYHQENPSSEWVIEHNLNKYPSVTVMDTGGTVVIGDVTYDSLNKVTIVFLSEFGGDATLN